MAALCTAPDSSLALPACRAASPGDSRARPVHGVVHREHLAWHDRPRRIGAVGDRDVDRRDLADRRCDRHAHGHLALLRSRNDLVHAQ